MGATTAPRTAQWRSQAACLALGAAYHQISYIVYTANSKNYVRSLTLTD